MERSEDDPDLSISSDNKSKDEIPIRFPRGIIPGKPVVKEVERRIDGLQDGGLTQVLKKRMPSKRIHRSQSRKQQFGDSREGLADEKGMLEHLERKQLARQELERRWKEKKSEEIGFDEEVDYEDRDIYDYSMLDIIKLKLSLNKRRAVVFLIVLTLILTPLFVTELERREEPSYLIQLDGNFQDWGKIRMVEDSNNELTNGGLSKLDLVNAALTFEDNKIFIYAEVRDNQILKGDIDDIHSSGEKHLTDTVLVFIDIDPSLDQGYDIYNIEADFVAEVHGYGNEPVSGILYEFNERHRTLFKRAPRNNKDWSAWEFFSWVTARSTGSKLELGFSLGEIDKDTLNSYEFVIQTKDHLGNYDFLDQIISLEIPNLFVQRTENPLDFFSESELIASTNHIWLFSLELKSFFGNSNIDKITFMKYGTLDDSAVNSILLFEDSDSDGRYTSADSLYTKSDYGFISGLNELNLPGNGLSVEEDQRTDLHVIAELNRGGLDITGLNFGIELSRDSFFSDSIVTFEKDTIVGDKIHYFINSPSTITIDGIFTDWATSSDPKVITDTDSEPVTDFNINIQKYGYLFSNSELDVYLSLSGRILNGDCSPLHLHYIYTSPAGDEKLPDLDHDGRYDADSDGYEEDYKTLDNDYDNDGIPDDVDPDLDNDKVLNDNDLEPRDPTVGHIYPDLPGRLGLDIIRIYVDLDGDRRTGYTLEGARSKMGAELLLEFRGRDNEINFETVLVYGVTENGADTLGWQQSSKLSETLKSVADLKNLEAGLNLTEISDVTNKSPGFEPDIYFIILKWDNSEMDHSNNINFELNDNFLLTRGMVPVISEWENNYLIQLESIEAYQRMSNTYMILTAIFVAAFLIFLIRIDFFKVKRHRV